MSSTVAVTLIGILLLAILLLLGYVLRVLRRASERSSAAAADPEQAVTGTPAQASLVEAAGDAEKIRTTAQAEAAGIVSQAKASAEQAERSRRALEDEIRTARDEAAGLRGDLERREGHADGADPGPGRPGRTG